MKKKKCKMCNCTYILSDRKQQPNSSIQKHTCNLNHGWICQQCDRKLRRKWEKSAA